MSAAGDVCLLAIGSSLPIGCDIEIVDTRRRIEPILSGFFLPQERDLVNRALERGGRRHAVELFTRIWALKEAAVKCLGFSIGSDSLALDTTSIVSRAGAPPTTSEPVEYAGSTTAELFLSEVPTVVPRTVIALASSEPFGVSRLGLTVNPDWMNRLI
jgi:phosphopantetheinyl transferase (holo-ACP synthase)